MGIISMEVDRFRNAVKTHLFWIAGWLCLCLVGCQDWKQTAAEKEAAKTWSELRLAMVRRDEDTIRQMMTPKGRKAIKALADSDYPRDDLDILQEFAVAFGESNIKW